MQTAQIIVIDGGANVGKATQADMLMHRLIDEGYMVGKMDFPRYHQNAIGHIINECLEGKCGPFEEMDPRVIATLYAADRFESKKQIEEWVAEGRVIIFDRYVSANMLHQGARIADIDERGEFFQWLEHIEYEIFGMPRPNLTIYLDIPPDESLKLLEYVEEIGGAVTGDEDKNRLHQSKVSECARYLSATHEQWKKVPCTSASGLRTREDIHAEVYAIAKEHLGQTVVDAVGQ